jgi:cadmium resistance protein CadD (predicted permease)
MWNQIVATFVILILATYLVQLFVPRARHSTRRTSVRWDVAPVVGFLAVVLLALAFAEALHRAMLAAWLIGLLGGLGLGVVVWIALGARADWLPTRRESALRATVRVLRVFGPPALMALLLFALAARVFGSIVEVFGAALAGALVLAMAVWLFLVSQPVMNDK